MPLPLLGVHSGKTTMALDGCCARSVSRSTRSAEVLGDCLGAKKARSIAWNRDMGSTSLVEG